MYKKSVDNETKIFYALKTLKWCKLYFGENPRKRTKMKFILSDRPRKIKTDIAYGSYCFYRNSITIYLPNNKTIFDIVSTVIHEYTHYLQSRLKYREYEKTRFYSQNPLERSARRNEELYTKQCIKEIKHLR